jgi:hypothetical protein
MALKLVAHTPVYNDGSGRVQVEMTLEDLRVLEAMLKGSVTGWIEPKLYETIASFGKIQEALRDSVMSSYPKYPLIK